MLTNHPNIIIKTTTGTESKTFSTRYDGNIVITNYRPDSPDVLTEGPSKKGEFRIDVQHGYSQASFGSFGPKTKVSNKEYNIFQALSGLDGDQSNISNADLQNANSLVGKLGITKIRRDKEAGVVTIVHQGGQIRFDVVDKEQQAKINTAKAEEQKAQELLKYFKDKGFEEDFEITLSEDNKTFLVKLKDNADLGDIKDKFGIRTGFFVTKKDKWTPEFNSDNYSLLNKRISVGEDGIVYYDYDAIRLEANDVIKIPVDEVNRAESFWDWLF